MNFLAVDTSLNRAHVSFIQGFRVTAYQSNTFSAAHSETLLPLIDDVIQGDRTVLENLNYIACGVGPGSFTGLRIGCATVKTLALLYQKKLRPFSSLMAVGFSSEVDQPLVLANAFQGLLFYGYFKDDLWTEDIVSLEKLGSFIETTQTKKTTLVLTDEKVASFLEIKNCPLDKKIQTEITPNGIQKTLTMCSSELVSSSELKPHYLRASNAEEKLEAIQK